MSALTAVPLAGQSGAVVVAAAPAALGKNTNNDYRLSDAKATRAARYLLRDELIGLSGMVQLSWNAERGNYDTFPGRVAMCGRRRIDKTKPVTAKIRDGVAHLSGLQLCGSIWACPVCQAKIRQERSNALQEGLAGWFLGQDAAPNENRGAFVTFTVQHHQGLALEDTLDAVSEAFREIMATPTYRGRKRTRTMTFPRDDGKLVELLADGWEILEQADAGLTKKGEARRKVTFLVPGERQLLDIVGTIRALEVTVGGNGWHPHAHVLVVTGRHLVKDELDALKAAWFGRWRAAVRRRGLDASERHGVDVRPLDRVGLGDYVTKVQDQEAVRSITMEMTRPDLKAGRRKGRTPFQVLQDCVAAGELDAMAGMAHAAGPDGRALSAAEQVKQCGRASCREAVCVDARLWREYEEATKGHKVLTWSRGLKDLLDVETEEDKSDEEIANEEQEEAEVVLVLDELQWRLLCGVKGARARLLETIELAANEDRSRAGLGFLDELMDEHPEKVAHIERTLALASPAKRWGLLTGDTDLQ